MGCRCLGFCYTAPVPRWLVLAAVLGWGVAPALSRAADVETRDFQVMVDNKPAGEAHMTFHRQDDGTTIMSCDTDVKVQILVVSYKYSYRGREVWKDGRLQRFDSTCIDDNKRFTVAAVAENGNLRFRVNDQERIVPGNIWLTSYWNKPDPGVHNQTVAIIDADNGKDLSAQVLYTGLEQRNVAGQLQQVHHYRLTGPKVNVDLWYDGANRLVRQEFVEQGHRTLLEMIRLRR